LSIIFDNIEISNFFSGAIVKKYIGANKESENIVQYQYVFHSLIISDNSNKEKTVNNAKKPSKVNANHTIIAIKIFEDIILKKV
jgi:hypothetical protein